MRSEEGDGAFSFLLRRFKALEPEVKVQSLRFHPVYGFLCNAAGRKMGTDGTGGNGGNAAICMGDDHDFLHAQFQDGDDQAPHRGR